MDSLKTFLDKTLNTKTPSWQQKLIIEWHDVVGNLSNIMALEKVQNTTLIIGVYEHSWVHELYMLSDVIIKTINQHLKEPKVEKLHFKLATRAEKTFFIPTNTTSEKQFYAPLTTSEERALINIQDPELRTALSTFLLRCKKQKSTNLKRGKL